MASINPFSLKIFSYLLVVLVVYYLLPRKKQNYWLLLISYLFYASLGIEPVVVLFGFTLFNYLIAWKLDNKDKPRPGLLWLGILGNIGTLAYFKYADFFIPNILQLLNSLGLRSSTQGEQIIFPLGLSFLILQAISYLADVYQGRIKASRDLVDFSLYIAYFPKIISGPIERAKDFLPKLAQHRVVTNTSLAQSFALIVIGLVRKLIIANSLATLIPEQAFNEPDGSSGLMLLMWAFAYAFMLYNDFAGYSSIARGVSGLFGIPLSRNFQLPYFSINFNEFWNRWHISLSHWLRDYIIFPLSRALRGHIKSQVNLLNIILPPMVTMLVSGLWHGVSVNMLFWGGLHGLFLVVNRILALLGARTPANKEALQWRQWTSRITVFLLTMLAWIPFYTSIETALIYWKNLITKIDQMVTPALWARLFVEEKGLLLLLIGAIGLDLIQHYYKDEIVFLRWRISYQAVSLAMITILLFILNFNVEIIPFIYEGF